MVATHVKGCSNKQKRVNVVCLKSAMEKLGPCKMHIWKYVRDPPHVTSYSGVCEKNSRFENHDQSLNPPPTPNLTLWN